MSKRAKPITKPKPRNPVAQRLSEGRYQPRKDRPKKGKGSYRRKSSGRSDNE